MNPRYITFEKILTGGSRQLFLNFPGKHGSRRGPFSNRQAAWEEYVRMAREVYFWFEPEKPIIEMDPD